MDDNAEVRAALSRWFSFSMDFDWAGALAGPEGLEDALVKLEPDVALIDWDLPGVNTYELLTRLVPAHPGTVFAVLSAHVEAPLIRAALKAGALGYLSKGRSPAQLAAEVRMLAERLQVFSEDVMNALLSGEGEPG